MRALFCHVIMTKVTSASSSCSARPPVAAVAAVKDCTKVHFPYVVQAVLKQQWQQLKNAQKCISIRGASRPEAAVV